MIIEDIIMKEDGLIVVDWIGDSIDEDKLLRQVGSHFGEDASYDLLDFNMNEDSTGGVAYVKQLRGDEMRNEMKDLEDAQSALVNGGSASTEESLAPVARVAATDEQVDALVEEAVAELDGNKQATPAVAPVTVKKPVVASRTKAVKKYVKPTEKKVKKIDIARKIFASNTKQERKVVIGKIIEKTGLSPVAAATYYQICKRES